MISCAFLPCAQVTACCLVGGCIQQRFGSPRQSASTVDPLKTGAKTLVGTKPARTNRDPARIKRRRKQLVYET